MSGEGPTTAVGPIARARLAEAASRHGLETHVEAILSLAQPAAGAMSLGPDDYTLTGSSRFGGDPDLPPGLMWPRRDTGNLPGAAVFIAQIELAALPVRPSGLPSEGLLSLFVQGTESAAEPVEIHGFHFPKGSTLERRRSPASDELCDEYLIDLRPVRVSWQATITIADVIQSGLADTLGAKWDSLYAMMAEIDGDAIGHVGGHARDHGDRDLRLFAVLEREGHPDAEPVTAFESAERLAAFLPQASDYRRRELMRLSHEATWWFEHRMRLLAECDRWHSVLRVESNEEMGLQINDADPIIFLAHEDDLAAGRFDRMVGRVLQG